jgi:hypothetical protein
VPPKTKTKKDIVIEQKTLKKKKKETQTANWSFERILNIIIVREMQFKVTMRYLTPLKRAISKKIKFGRVAQVVECLPSKHEALLEPHL